MESKRRKLSVGDWVEIRSKKEILATLDSNGKLDGVPFMPEMLAFCGKRFQVYRRAHKTCDTVFPNRGRRVEGCVHLETRCEGSAHGGCQAACLLFWKEAWLKPVGLGALTGISRSVPKDGTSSAGCSEVALQAVTQTTDPETGVPVYSCQATQLPYFTSELNWWEVGQYIEDYRSGNVTLKRIFAGLIYSIFYNLSQSGIGLGGPIRWLYDRAAPMWTQSRFPRHTGPIPEGESTPAEKLDLQPGEMVRVKSHEEILRTLNTAGKNRGMYFDAELVPYCGGTYRVRNRVEKIINEQTGKMQMMKNPCIILEGATCQSRYSGCRMFCPRAIYSWWREVWLERANSSVASERDLESDDPRLLPFVTTKL